MKREPYMSDQSSSRHGSRSLHSSGVAVVEILAVHCWETKWMDVVLAAYLQDLDLLTSRRFDELTGVLKPLFLS